MSPYLDDEQRLIADLLDNRSDAFRFLVEHYYISLLRIAIAIAGKADADGIVQESWISIIKALPRFEQRASLKTWMSRIVANEAKRRLRKQHRELAGEDLISDSLERRFDQRGHWSEPLANWDIDTPEGLLEEHQLRRCIEATLKRLPDKQQAVFCLRYMEDYSLAEICNILAIGESNVRVILYRGRTRLLETIERFQVTGEC